MLHWLIVIPYYFFGALALAALLAVGSRCLRIAVAAERLDTLAVLGSGGVLALLLGSGVVGIDQLTILPMLGLAIASFVLAGVDAILMPHRPLPSDAHKRSTTEPPVL